MIDSMGSVALISAAVKKIFERTGGAKALPVFFASAADAHKPADVDEAEDSLHAISSRSNATLTEILQLFEVDPSLEEVLVNGIRSMTLKSRGSAREQRSLFTDEIQMIDWIQSLSIGLGVRLDPLHPFAGGLLRDQSFRWHCILPPVASGGPIFSLRRHRFEALTLADFSWPQGGAIGNENSQMVENDFSKGFSKIQSGLTRGAPFLIAGPTGAGKTSFLHALLESFCANERVFLIEQLSELPLTSAHWVRLVARAANYEGVGAVNLSSIIAESMRMRPDRLVVGEIRGAEARAFLEAQSTGHRGSLATIHAGSVEGAVARLFDLARLSHRERLSWQLILKDLIVIRMDSEMTSGRSKIHDIRSPNWDLLFAKEYLK